MMPYGASKPGCDMLGNLQTLFLDTQAGHCLPFFWRACRDGWSTAHQIRALQSFVDAPLRGQGCKHCSVKDRGLKHREQLRAWGVAESNDFLWLPGFEAISWSLTTASLSTLGPLLSLGCFIFRTDWGCAWWGTAALLIGATIEATEAPAIYNQGFTGF